MRESDYYQPPEPIREAEEFRLCGNCGADTLHYIAQWSYQGATAECLNCTDVTEIEE